MIPTLTPEQRSEVVYAFLKVGVPPSAVSRALGINLEQVQGAQSLIRIEKHGTDEASEAMTELIWTAIEEFDYQLRHGTPANKFRALQLVLARSIALAGKSSPEQSEKIRAALDAFAREQAPTVRLGDSIYTPSD